MKVKAVKVKTILLRYYHCSGWLLAGWRPCCRPLLRLDPCHRAADLRGGRGDQPPLQPDLRPRRGHQHAGDISEAKAFPLLFIIVLWCPGSASVREDDWPAAGGWGREGGAGGAPGDQDPQHALLHHPHQARIHGVRPRHDQGGQQVLPRRKQSTFTSRGGPLMSGSLSF